MVGGANLRIILFRVNFIGLYILIQSGSVDHSF